MAECGVTHEPRFSYKIFAPRGVFEGGQIKLWRKKFLDWRKFFGSEGMHLIALRLPLFTRQKLYMKKIFKFYLFDTSRNPLFLFSFLFPPPAHRSFSPPFFLPSFSPALLSSFSFFSFLFSSTT
jgi:hypothetical protein